MRLADLVALAVTEENKDDRLIFTDESDELVTYLRVRYDGFCERGEEVSTSDLGKKVLTRVQTGDLVFSHINAIHGAVAIVPPALAGLVVTNEYTVCRSNQRLPANVLWTLIRSVESRAELLLLATGIGRTRVKWPAFGELRLPIPPDTLRDRLSSALQKADKAEAAMLKLRSDVSIIAAGEMQLDSERARTIVAAFRPPR